MTDETEALTVAALAREVGVPTSEVIELCASLGIAADWGGAKLDPLDADRIRAMFGADGTEHPEATSPPPTTPSSATSVPGLASADDAETPTAFAGARYAADAQAEEASPDPVRRVEARVDRSVRPAVVGAALAVIALIASDLVGPVALVFGLWILATFSAVVAVVSGNRARARITLHPEKHRGLAPAATGLAVGALALVSILLGGFLAFRSAPAADAPLGFGERPSVEKLRWSGQRLLLVGNHGWHRPTADPGTCFVSEDRYSEPAVVDIDRDYVEEMDRQPCTSSHSHEILAVYAVDPVADAPFEPERIRSEAMDRCIADFADIDPSRLVVEMADEDGWDRADHDVACHYVELRKGSVLDD